MMADFSCFAPQPTLLKDLQAVALKHEVGIEITGVTKRAANTFHTPGSIVFVGATLSRRPATDEDLEPKP